MSSFSTSADAGALIITLTDPSELNDFRSNTFRETLYEAVQGGDSPNVVLDLAVVDYLSSSGVALLVGLKRRVEARGGRLIVAGIHPSVMKILRVMNLAPFFTFTGDVAEGLAALRPLPTA